MIDNKAALTAASLGATWRTRYYAVRAKRLLEENQQGRVQFKYCPTKEMVADALTKLATANVIQVLVNAMDGRLPTRTMAHRTSVTPGPANRGDIAGDGPVHNHHGSNKYLQNKRDRTAEKESLEKEKQRNRTSPDLEKAFHTLEKVLPNVEKQPQASGVLETVVEIQAPPAEDEGSMSRSSIVL